MSLDSLVTFLDGYVRDNVSTGMPAIVLAVDEFEGQQFISAKPALSRLMETGQVIFPSGGGALLSFPIKVGDTVWLQFSQRNLEDWVYSDGQSEVIPGDSRHFSMTDAVAFPCIYTALSNLKPSGTNVELKWDNKKISLKPSGEIEITNGSAVVKLNPSGTITANGCTITTGGNVITANGTDLDAFYQDYLAHRHSGVTPGGGNTGTKV
jgi:hypothetical protein